MPVALIWLIAALGLAGAEALTGDLFLLMLSGGALAAAGSSLRLRRRSWSTASCSWWCRCCCWCWCGPRCAGASAGHRAAGPAKALEGKSALVLDRVARHEGQVKLDGEVWTARPVQRRRCLRTGRPRHRRAHRRRHRRRLKKSSREAWATTEGTVMEGAVAGLILRRRAGGVRRHHRRQVDRADPAGRGRGDRTARPLQQDRVGAADAAAAVRRQDPRAGWTCASGWCRSRRSR